LKKTTIIDLISFAMPQAAMDDMNLDEIQTINALLDEEEDADNDADEEEPVSHQSGQPEAVVQVGIENEGVEALLKACTMTEDQSGTFDSEAAKAVYVELLRRVDELSSLSLSADTLKDYMGQVETLKLNLPC
jgi:hypothetical protein